MEPDTPLKRTPLHEIHLALGARMMGFAGYDMPVQYRGIIQEHLAVRTAAGLFDVSHMGEILVRGENAFNFVQNLVTNDAARLYDGRAMYTVMCKPDAGIVDDLLVYRLAPDEYMLVINAANIEKDYRWMLDNNEAGAELTNISEETALIAIQGPNAFAIVQKLSNIDLVDLKYYHFSRITAANFSSLGDVIVSHTGYTGEKGIEIYCTPKNAPSIWQALMEAGNAYGLVPVGLGARDTLRLEAGYALYGNDITEDTNPLEAGLGWIVKLEKGDFIGRQVLEEIKSREPKRHLVGFVMEERGIPRHGFQITNNSEDEIGFVTSGSQSPILEKGIGLGYVINHPEYTTPGMPIAISIRGRAVPAQITKPPFHKK